MNRPVTAAFALLALCAAARAGEGPGTPSPAYPPTRKADVVDVVHGEKIADPYRWHEDDDALEVIAWDRAQHAFLRGALDAVPEREALKARIDAELDLEGTRGVPNFHGGRAWFEQRAAGANHPVLYAQDRDGEDPPKAILDPNAWAADGTEGLVQWLPSPDGKLLAYGRDSKGSEAATLYLRDLSTGKDSGFALTRMKHSSIAWAPDSSGFWYTRLPDPESVPPREEQLHRRTYFHALGSTIVDDEPVYGTGRPSIESMDVFSSSDEKTVFLTRGEPYRNDDFFTVERKEGRTIVKPVFVGAPATATIDRIGDRFVVMTDWDAPNKRVLAAPIDASLAPAQWKTVIPEGTTVLDRLFVARDRLVILVREDIVSRLRVFDADGKDLGDVPLPGPGSINEVSTKPGDPRVWFEFEAYDHPTTTYTCDVSRAERTLVELEKTATTIAASKLVTERFRYPSKDGTEIPLFVLRRKDVPLDGKAPLVLYGYGGFRVSLTPYWSRGRALWAELGGVLAVACLRGGDELGEAWHEAGCLGNKQNVFDDMIAGADWLVSTGRASRERMAIEGGSNGGLLVAAVANQRPDLCRAVVCAVPLTDMLRYHRFQYAKTWTMEYGNPDVEAEFRWIRPYSPVHNVKAGAAYPAALVSAGLEDGRVDAFHARKIAAAWQAASSSSRPILLSIDRDSGHGSASRKQLKLETLDKVCFLVSQLGGPSIAGTPSPRDAATPPAPLTPR